MRARGVLSPPDRSAVAYRLLQVKNHSSLNYCSYFVKATRTAGEGRTLPISLHLAGTLAILNQAPAKAMMASPSFSHSSSSNSQQQNPRQEVLKEMRKHEIAIEELKSLSPSRVVYQKTCNIYFRSSIETAKILEQKKLEAAKAQLQKLTS